MNQYQYEKKNTDDPLAQEEEELQPQEVFHSSPLLMQGFENYERAKEKKKTFRFRMLSLAAAALILGPWTLREQSKLRNVKPLDYVNEFEGAAGTYEEEYAEEEEYPESDVRFYDFQYYDFHYEGGADAYYDPGDGELGNDPGEPEMILEGSYYRMPAPLHVFIENGWNVVAFNSIDDEIPKEIQGDREEDICLLKNDKLLYVRIGSPSGETIPIENSYVLRFAVDNGYNIDIELPAGIRIGADYDESVSRVSENILEDYSSPDDNYRFITYQIPLNSSGIYKYWNVELSTSNDEGTVDVIFIYTD